MFDIGWMELLVIGVVALIVVGPKDLPKMFRTVGQVMGRARGMAREFQRSMEQAAEESGLREAARDLNSVNKLNLNTPGGRKGGDGLMTGPKPGEAPRAPVDDSVPAAAPKVKAAAAAEPAPQAGEPAPQAGEKAPQAGEKAPQAGEGGAAKP